MTDVDVRDTALRYGVLGGGLTVAALTGLAAWQGFPLLLLGMLLVAVPMVVVPAIVGITDAGIETAAASARIGRSAGNPSQYNPGRILPIPNPLETVCWLTGVGIGGLVLIAAVA